MSSDQSQPAVPPPSSSPTKAAIGRTANVFAFAVSTVFSLAIAEIGFRVAMGVPVMDGTDWRAVGAQSNLTGDRAIRDPLLGWSLVPNYRTGRFNTIDHGIRRNFNETAVRTGAILAVGDSFTEGFDEVDDANTWPSHLEKLTGAPVVNAGVAGYGTDQIILRAEQILPLVKPKTLIVGFFSDDIGRTTLSESGAPKPYFTTENGELVYHPPGPIQKRENTSRIGNAVRAVLGHSALSHYLFSRLAADFWYPSPGSLYQSVNNDPIDISCKLLARLKQRTDDNQIRLLLFMQYAGELVLEEPVVVPEMRTITECAQKVGIQVVDQFAPLRALTSADFAQVARYYTPYGSEFGHMTPMGNEHAAEMLASALKQQPAPPHGLASQPLNTGQEPLPN